jgi:alpha-beta hydrolase superfamily lysophospholipase
MSHKTYSWELSGKKWLYAQSWKSNIEAKQTILLIHGLGEHSGRYEEWAKRFNTEGFNLVGFDLPGHGRSYGKRGHISSLDTLLNHIDFFLEKAELLFPDNQFILYGHSMGGNIALNYAIKRNYPFMALIVTSPWLKLTSKPSFLTQTLITLAQNIIPSLTLKVPFNPEEMTHDEERMSLYKVDPLNHGEISIRLYKEMNKAAETALGSLYKINHPLLLMHGTADPITSSNASKNYVFNASSSTHLKLWEGQYHELHNETNRDEVFEYIMKWVRKMMG